MANSNGTSDLITMEQALYVFTNLLERERFAGLAGMSFKGERDLYETLGYERQLEYRHYKARYERGGIAARIVNAFPAATWHNPPTITEVDKEDESVKSPFEEACEGLIKRLNLWHVFERVDRLACLGHYAVLVIGVRGQTNWEQPLLRVPGAESIAWLSAFSEEHVRIEALEFQDAENFGMPSMYEIDFNRGSTIANNPLIRPALGGAFIGKRFVHASRVIHVAQNGLEDNVVGTPILRDIWNLLDDLDKMQGGQAEICWVDAMQRFALKLDKDAHLSPDDANTLDTHVTEFRHYLRKFLKVQGMDVQELGGNVPDMTAQIDKTIDQIAGTKGMPKRLLIGSERGELASGQDENNWGTVVIDWQRNQAEPITLRPFFDKCSKIGALPTPRKGYKAEWPDPKPLTEQEKSIIALNWTKAIQTYASLNDGSIQEVLPLEVFLDDILGFDEEQIERIMERVEKIKMERETEDAEERAAQERLLRDRQAQASGQLPQEEL